MQTDKQVHNDSGMVRPLDSPLGPADRWVDACTRLLDEMDQEDGTLFWECITWVSKHDDFLVEE